MRRPITVRIGAALWLAPVALPFASLFRNPGVTARAQLLAVVLAVLAYVRPAWALAIAAALLPLGVTIGAFLQLHFAFTEPLAIAVIAGCGLRFLVEPRRLLAVEGSRLAWPALLALIVAASAVVQCAAAAAFYPSGAALAREIWDILTVHYFLDVGSFDVLRAALVMLEGLALLTAAIGALDGPRARTLMLRAVLVGGAGVAAQNLLRLSEIALRGGDFWTAIGRELLNARISAAFADVNTAGSYLAMVLVMAIVWAWRGRSVLGALLLPLLAMGLWISGSRTAMAAGALALPLTVAPRRGRWWIAGAFVLAAAVLLLGTQLVRKATAPSSALFIRVELLKAGARMLHASPVFGVGIGEFYEQSARFISPELARYYARENAHNQFMQVAAELGIVGLIAFLAIVHGAVRRRERADPLDQTCVAGIAAFLLTCLGGHPLLVTEVALTFWLVLGLTTTARRDGSTQSSVRRRRWWRLGIGATLAVLVITLPLRVRAARDALDLEHVAIGTSRWQHDADGTRYRRMGRHARFYVPAPAMPLRFAVRVSRAAEDHVPVRLALTLDGRPANEFVVAPGKWQPVELLVPGVESRKYRALGLTVVNPTGGKGPYLDVSLMRAEP